MTSLSEFLRGCDPAFNNLGFDRAAFMALLGISSDTTPTPAPAATKWEPGIFLRQWFTINEAACIATGHHPDEMERWEWDYWPREVGSMRRAIIDAGPELELDMDGWGGEPQGHHKVSHKSIAAWCVANRVVWPLDIVKPAVPITGIQAGESLADALRRLADAEAQAANLRHQLEEVTAEREGLQAQLRQQVTALETALKDAAKAKADAEKMRADLLQGKAKSTALKLIGGMAMDGYRVAIHQPRLTNMSDIMSGLQGIDGAAVGEDTLRSILKEAAQLIPAPKARKP